MPVFEVRWKEMHREEVEAESAEKIRAEYHEQMRERLDADEDALVMWDLEIVPLDESEDDEDCDLCDCPICAWLRDEIQET